MNEQVKKLDLEFQEREQKRHAKALEYNQELRARAKSREELLVSVDCTITKFDGSTHQYVYVNELRVGGRSQSNYRGNISRTVLEVETDTLVEKLEFPELLPLEKGDTIRAYIFVGKEEREKNDTLYEKFIHTLGRQEYKKGKPHLVERVLKEKETPEKIEKLRDGQVVATYHH